MGDAVQENLGVYGGREIDAYMSAAWKPTLYRSLSKKAYEV